MKLAAELLPYADMLDLPRPTQHHAAMSTAARAAQFAPYATLTGHQDIVRQDEQTAAAKVDLDQEVTIEYDS